MGGHTRPAAPTAPSWRASYAGAPPTWATSPSLGRVICPRPTPGGRPRPLGTRGLRHSRYSRDAQDHCCRKGQDPHRLGGVGLCRYLWRCDPIRPGHVRAHVRAFNIIRAVCQERPVSSPVSVHLVERHEPDRALARVLPHGGRRNRVPGEEEVAFGRVSGHKLAL